MIKRYDFYDDCRYEHEDGDWVKWEDAELYLKERNMLYYIWMDLINSIDKELTEDGWCRLVIEKHKLDEMKKFMERFA